jgi:arabinose-5-phosphate isomerase
MQQHARFDQLKASDVMTKNPKTISSDTMAVEALEVMKSFNISQLVVTDREQYAGFIHLHDLLREGIL